MPGILNARYLSALYWLSAQEAARPPDTSRCSTLFGSFYTPVNYCWAFDSFEFRTQLYDAAVSINNLDCAWILSLQDRLRISLAALPASPT